MKAPLSIRTVDIVPRTLSAVTRRVTLPELASVVQPELGVVWQLIRARGVTNFGLNVIVYTAPFDTSPRDGVDVWFGVELDPPLVDGRVVATQTLAGRALTATHTGPYSGLPAAHYALIDFARARKLALAGPHQEVYGHHHDNPALLTTDIYWLLA